MRKTLLFYWVPLALVAAGIGIFVASRKNTSNEVEPDGAGSSVRDPAGISNEVELIAQGPL